MQGIRTDHGSFGFRGRHGCAGWRAGEGSPRGSTRDDEKESQMTEIDQTRLERFVGQAVGDMAAAISGLLVHLGDRLGLYRAMAGAGPVTPEALAGQTGTAPRYVREWLSNQAAGGYVAGEGRGEAGQRAPVAHAELAEQR